MTLLAQGSFPISCANTTFISRFFNKDPVQSSHRSNPSRIFVPSALQVFSVNTRRLQNQRRNLRREDSLWELLRLRNSWAAHEASYVPVIAAQSAMLLDFLFGGRACCSDERLDEDVGYEGAVDWGAETWIAIASEMG